MSSATSGVCPYPRAASQRHPGNQVANKWSPWLLYARPLSRLLPCMPPLTRHAPKECSRILIYCAAPLIMESNMIGNAKSAPSRKPWQAVRERVGIFGTLSRAEHRRTLRPSTGRIRCVSYATFSFPTHTRMAGLPGSYCGPRTGPRSPSDRPPFGLGHNRYVHLPRLPARGSSVLSNVIGKSERRSALPSRLPTRPTGTPDCLPRPDRSCRFPSSQAAGENVTNNPSPVEGKTPYPFFLTPKLHPEGSGSSLGAHLFPDSLHAKCRDIFRASPGLALTTYRAGAPSIDP